MANYFSTLTKNTSKKEELRAALQAIYDEEKRERINYLDSVEELIKNRPNLTAAQYAAILTNDAAERNSIITSISQMAYAAEYHREFVTGKLDKFAADLDPSLPKLKRKEITIRRRFIEVNENNQPIGTHEYEECKYTYSIED